MKSNLVVCGYPKSGTTWLSRLLADLVSCPLRGSLGFSVGDALEGADRVSDYNCYTTHHPYAALAADRVGECSRLLYIVRDPRDVAISAAHHFQLNLFSVDQHGARLFNAVKARANRAVPYAWKRKRMINAVLYGDESLSYWLAKPWRDHYREFRLSGTMIVKYEDLIDDPKTKCLEILSNLDLQRSDERIREAILNQSFDRKKMLFKSQRMLSEYRFLRRGRYGYWREELSQEQKQVFAREIGKELLELSYAIF